jgi:hypothetical protein
MTICDPLATMRDSNLNHHLYPPPSIYLIFFWRLVCLSYTPTTFQTAVSCKKRHFLCFLWPTAVWNVVGRLDKQVKIVLSFLLMVSTRFRFISLLFFLWCSKSCAELLTKLPGQPGNFPFEKYSGYIVKDAKHGVLFYNFVEAQSADPLSCPWPYGSMEVCIMLDILSTLFYFFFPVYKKRFEPETSLEDWNASWAYMFSGINFLPYLFIVIFEFNAVLRISSP